MIGLIVFLLLVCQSWELKTTDDVKQAFLKFQNLRNDGGHSTNYRENLREEKADQSNWGKERIKRRITQSVASYATEMETAHGINRPVGPAETSIYQYTYKTTTNSKGETTKLPLVVRARITKVKPENSRKDEVDISSEARTNCKRMGMNKGRADNNDDQLGHLIAYKHYGSAEFYNIVPQTRRINVGTRPNSLPDHSSSLDAPSLWAITERYITTFVSKEKGVMDLTVVVMYEGTNTRPAAFGVSETPLDNSFNPHPTQTAIPTIWYSNDPEEDPDSANH